MSYCARLMFGMNRVKVVDEKVHAKPMVSAHPVGSASLRAG